jgi:hypothetical protein
MATPVDVHPEQTIYKGDENNNIGDLAVLRVEYADGGRACVSAWKMNWCERLQVLIGRPVYLVVRTHEFAQPPIMMTTDKTEAGAAG